MRPKLRFQFLVLSLMLLAFGIRLVHSNQSFWLDEAAQAMESARPLSEQLSISGDFQPPLYHLIVYLFEFISRQEWWLRLASIIPGVITIWFVMRIARDLGNERTALITGLLGTFSAYHYYFSQELRPYSLAAVFATMSMYYFLRLINPPKKTEKVVVRHLSIAYVITSALALYSMYLTVFLLATQLLITLILYSIKVRSVLSFQSLVILLFLPWLPAFWQQLQNGTGLAREYVGWSAAVSLPWFKSLPLTAVRFMIGMIRVDFNLSQVVLGVLIVGILGYLVLPVLKQKFYQLIAIWLVLPIIMAFIVSFFIPILEPKRVLFCLPALWILLAQGIAQAKLKTPALILLAAVYLLPLYSHLTEPTLLREDWRSSVRYIEQVGSADSVVLFAFPGPFAPYSWYADPNIPTLSTGIFTVTDIGSLNSTVKDALLYNQVIVYDYLMDLSDPQRLIYSWLRQNGYHESAIKDFRGIGFIRTYAKVLPVASGYLHE